MENREQIESQLAEKGICMVEDGRFVVENSEENKDVIRMLRELTE